MRSLEAGGFGTGGRGGFERLTALFVAALLFAWLPAGAATIDAERILRAGEDVRNPDTSYAVDFRIHSTKPFTQQATGNLEWDAEYSMVAHGKDRTLILMRSPENFFGGFMLMSQGRYWLLLPRAIKPLELSAVQMLRGDVSNGDVARADLTSGYTVRLDGEEDVEREPCWRLVLDRSGSKGNYSRIVYWVSKQRFHPKKLDYYGNTGRPVRSATYSDYKKGALGVRSMRIDIVSVGDWSDRSTLSFNNLRKCDRRPVPFLSDELPALRDAALSVRESSGGEQVPLERILEAAEARGRKSP